MSKLHCINCGTLFTPAPQVPNQKYCSKLTCQKTRRQQWQKNRLQNDPDYRENQSRAQRNWSKKNPDYWRQYRQTKLDYENLRSPKEDFQGTESGKSSVNMDSLSPPSALSQVLQDGVFRLKVLAQPRNIKIGVWIVELSSVHEGSKPISHRVKR